MFGVVLWSDHRRNRAVIWCEDHGDLAFYKGDGLATLDGVEMEPGDLVQFTVHSDRNMRLASNPRLVASDEYPTLAHDLKNAGQLPDVNPSVSKERAAGKIVAFEPKSVPSSTHSRAKRHAV